MKAIATRLCNVTSVDKSKISENLFITDQLQVIKGYISIDSNFITSTILRSMVNNYSKIVV